MQQKSTTNLQQELMDNPKLDSFLTDNETCFNQETAAQTLTRLFEQKALSKAALAKQAYMSEIYLHQIFAGRRNPSRNRLLCLCYGLDATLEETQELLKLCGHAQLYPKIRRDAIILYGIVHHEKLPRINDRLFREDEETLF